LGRSVELGRLSAEQAQEAAARVRPTSQLADLAAAGLVIEAIFEDVDAKAALFRELDAVLADDAIIASNTSTLSITRLASTSRRPERVVGMHFCLPAQLMKLVEVTPGLLTDTRSLEAAEAVCRSLGQ